MHLEIVSPEATLFAGEVTSVTVPGVEGEFQMLKDHAAIVSLLQEGDVKFDGTTSISKAHASKFSNDVNGKTVLHITSGTVEMKDNKIIILAD
ncbi:F-type H+-transporting ATPase subunit epsilon [Pricia antarctica]|uniref:F-type H+-transporting ATPase subunit epsilon n=1 Tax=Pricia antarctica TaxID=641691 RepID=A0A1G6W734_9FLAO|nr:F0F1 ATP synthase subunit epsilon [Pricia antarctica]SDD60845.1 F-type H+-transporting ATPase subunit epsilon [Pricia antarctica]